MLYPEQIYDLDTITLEEKTQQLERTIHSNPEGCPKSMLRILQLAKLEIGQRRNIEQFGLDLEQDIKLFEQYCMYPVQQQSNNNKIVSLRHNKDHQPKASREMIESVKLLPIKTHRKVDCSILEVLKRTKINTGAMIMSKGAITPVVNHLFKKKTVREQNKTIHQESNCEPMKQSKRVNSRKKIPIMNPPYKKEARQKLLLNQQKRPIVSKPVTESNRTSIQLTHSVVINTCQKPIHTNIKQISSRPIESTISQKKQAVIKNNIKFIENDIYSDSDEEKWTQTTTIKSKTQLRSQQSVESHSERITKQAQQQCQTGTSKEDYQKNTIVQQKIQKNSQLFDSVNILEESEKQRSPKVADSINYFRLTVVHRKAVRSTQLPWPHSHSMLHSHPTSIKTDYQDIPEIISVNVPAIISQSEVTTHSIQPLPVEESTQQRPNDQTIQQLSQKKQDSIIDLSQSVVQKPHQSSLRKTHNFFANHNKLPNPVMKIIAELPPIITEYHKIIPSFFHLFSPNADVVPLLWQMVEMLRQHLAKVNLPKHFKPNLANNMQQFDTYVNYSTNKIRLYGNKIDLDLRLFESRDNIARLRATGQFEPPCEHQVFYYRVIKTKQQVYDIMSSSFNRTSNWAELPHGMNLKNSWNMLWTWAKPQIQFKKLLCFQKVNHFPHNKHISRKDMLKKNIEKIKRLGPKTQTLFDIMPESYLLPGENSLFLERYMHHSVREGNQNLWIMKPIGLSRGRGISLINNLDQVIFNEPVVLQKYLKNPLLLDGYKFDMRIYVLLTSINPLELFLYREGFARLSTQKYTLDEDDLKNNFIHLTNFAIQRENYTPEGFSLGGTKISLKMLRQKLKCMSIDWQMIWTQVKEIVIKSCIASMNEIPPNANCFQLFGYDIIIDSDLKCWLLEVNSSPSLEREFLLDEIIKQQLIDDTVEIVDAPQFDRQRLLEVLQRRAMQIEGRKSFINPTNNTTLQLNRDLHYILHGRPLRQYGTFNQSNPNYEMVAPSPLYYSIIRNVQAYKLTNIIRKSSG